MKDELGEFEIRGNGVKSGMQGKRKIRKKGKGKGWEEVAGKREEKIGRKE